MNFKPLRQKGRHTVRDEKIAQLLKCREETGLSALADKYEKLLFYIASGILGDHTQDIEECVNDSYMKIWNHADKLDLKKASLKTYLKVVTRNTALNRLRQLMREQEKRWEGGEEVLAGFTDFRLDCERHVVQKEEMEALEAVFSSLKSRDKELVLRKYFYLQPSKEISRKMDMSVTAVDSRLSRLRLKMKQEWERRQ